VVDIFRRPEALPEIVEQAIQIRAKVVWTQEGIVHEEAAARAQAASLRVVSDRCKAECHRWTEEGLFNRGEPSSGLQETETYR
jgi:predicted CoA-binding protein